MLRVCACARVLRVYCDSSESRRQARIRPSHDLFPSLPFPVQRLVPLGKCWRRQVAPTDLTIDKDAFSDLLSPGRCKEMSFSSHDKYPNRASLGNKDEIVATPWRFLSRERILPRVRAFSSSRKSSRRQLTIAFGRASREQFG